MSAEERREGQWAPRNREWKLAHHLLPAFVMAGFLIGLGIWALVLQSLLFGVPLVAFGIGTVVSLVREFRLTPDARLPELSAVDTSSGLRASTRFAYRHNSAAFAAATVGLGVIGLVAALAAVGKFALWHAGFERFWTIAGAIVLGVAGFMILREGLRLLRIASAEQQPGVFLTRSRVVVFGPLGLAEMYWRDMGSISAENPRGRTPLGRRGPALVVLRGRDRTASDGPEDHGTTARKEVVVQVAYLLADPNVLHSALVHYLEHPADRPELGTTLALERLAGVR
ncbi:MAG: hypothetical protein L0J08_03725 [Micrococcaceae bacterium]|nr:hypothetical protein [Micrococcaceae bacterium]MDN5885899.1 hypothetical protein [Micrococcaceae bacterium]MDN6170789.1 hypothetical protein [Micrococcaceae bacterium]MDN6177641.1 hypothetical protein [Micrococcaceae bacterium]